VNEYGGVAGEDELEVGEPDPDPLLPLSVSAADG
jgi:hypothetical protein